MKIIFFMLFTFVVSIFGFSVTIDEGGSASLSCGEPNEYLQIDSAEWTYDKLHWKNYITPSIENFAFFWGNFIGMCSSNVVANVTAMCFGKNSCDVDATREHFTKGCQYYMILKLEYSCLPCSPEPSRRKRVGMPSLGSSLYVGCTNLMARLPSKLSSIGCPHTAFVAKHVCTNTCSDTPVGASMFANQAHTVRFFGPTSETNFNTVFINLGNPLTYTQNGNLCVFDTPASKYECVNSTQNPGWRCTYRRQVIATHNVFSGHYENTMDV